MMITQSSQLNKSSNGSNGTTNINKRVSSGSKYSNSFAKNVTGSTGSSSKQSGGKKTKGRVKIKMEFIDNKLRRYTTFSKRKTGIMKKVSVGVSGGGGDDDEDDGGDSPGSDLRREKIYLKKKKFLPPKKNVVFYECNQTILRNLESQICKAQN
ncbi:hypothetical protein QR98_0069310 [Sarcoptes scabiei]|uniref:Uncharacterized protein n=1 Tax=Sarcoptes scabiei TaxID=52283 RepID=A0A132ABP5_SARSC|nr:hypothetical protein QR98_0069310 [Sarcoptes scabiei]